MGIFDGHELTKRQELFYYSLAFIPIIFYMYMGADGVYRIADKMAENPDNLIRGCMYYVKSYESKSGTELLRLKVDNDFWTDTQIYSRKSIISRNRTEFSDYIRKNQDLCHPVSYIKLDYLVGKKIFIYRYHGDFQFPKP